jgi:ribonuclease D
MWDAIERARQLPAEHLPMAIERDQDPPQIALVVNLLAAILNDFCARAHLAVSLTATMSDLRDLVRAKMQNIPPAETNILLSGWRRDFVLPVLRDVLEGKRSVRIANLQAESPFALE